MQGSHCFYIKLNPPAPSVPLQDISTQPTGDLPLQLPENNFLGWLECQMKNNNISIYFSYKECKYLTDFIKKEDVEDFWHPTTPVFISAQTGAGKTSFVHKVLIEKIMNESRKEHGKILLLCNRIALSRQCKYEAAEWARDEFHDTSFIDKFKNYTGKGVDQELHEFGPIHIFTYHQFYHQFSVEDTGALDKYKYIICDECHFFTSDSRFNCDTYEILKKIIKLGKSSVRIYMSATPEVAFEPIIRQEYKLIQQQKKELIDKYQKSIDKITPNALELKVFYAKLNKIQNTFPSYSEEYINDLQTVEYFISSDNNRKCLEEAKKEVSENYNLKIFFYHMARNYDYIKSVKIYKENKDLIDEIKSDNVKNSKWMVFVHSKKDGENLCQGLNKLDENDLSEEHPSKKSMASSSQDSSTAVFVSASNRDTDLEAGEAFDLIVKEAKFNQKVLITTSVLDNGINIKDQDIHHIAIDTYDRTEFIQMLGRLRIEEKETEITLYVKEYDINELRKSAKKAASNLIKRLIIDTYNTPKKISLFSHTDSRLDDEMYRLISNDPHKDLEYNQCAIYQLISYLNTLIEIIRNTEPEFCISFDSDSPNAERGILVQYYTDGDGKYKPWSRNIVDILGSRKDFEKRRVEERRVRKLGSFFLKYLYTFSDTFIKYLYNDAIPYYIKECINNDIYQLYLNQFADETEKKSAKNEFDTVRERMESQRSYSHGFDVWKILYDDFDDDEKDRFDYLNRKLKKLAKKLDFYTELASRRIVDPTALQYQWIEKEIPKEPEESTSPDFNRDINEMITTDEEVEENKPNSQYYSKDFLSSHGILIRKMEDPSDEEKAFEKTYLNGESLRKMLNKSVTINGKSCIIKSYRDSTEKHYTYYLLIEQKNPSDSPESK